MISMCKKLPVAIVGASGYTGEELVRLTLSHSKLDLKAVTSRQMSSRALMENFPSAPEDLFYTDATPIELAEIADVFLLALPHGESRRFAEQLLKVGKIVIDLSADFRIKNREIFAKYYSHEPPSDELLSLAVYGQPETNRAAIKEARLVACAGCYPTSIILPLAPLLSRKIISPKCIVINSLSGVSGAGRKADVDLLFCECNESARAYGGVTHRHIPEIEQELSRVAAEPCTVQFTPHLIPLTRGMITTIVARPQAGYDGLETDAILEILNEYYKEEPFVRVLPGGVMPRISAVARTNRCDISAIADGRTGNILLYSAIDNLTKGAGGQALQCLNILMGWEQTEGLPQ